MMRGLAVMRGPLGGAGDMMLRMGTTIASPIRPPYPYGEELVSQFLFTLRLCWFPLLISAFVFGYEAPGLQAENFLSIIGAPDRLGSFFVLAAVRETGPFIDGVIVVGVA